MPYTGPNDPKLPNNVQKLTEPQRDKWVKTFNSTFENCRDAQTGGGAGEVEKCETVAFKIANGTIKKEVGVVENEIKEVQENCKHGIPAEKCIACITGARSFEEAEEAMAIQDQANQLQELAYTAEGLVQNVLRSDEIEMEDKPNALQKIMTGFISRVRKIKPSKEVESEKQVTKTEGGVQFRASDYAVVPDLEKSSTWKLRLAEERSGNFTVAQVARAITAMSPAGFRGQKVELDADQKKQAVSRIKTAIGKTDGNDDQKERLRTRLNAVKEIKDSPMFMITKDKDGNMRWLGIPSNKWRDRDNPPQIIEESAHKEFIDYLDSTKDYPVLLSWHTPGTQIGRADFADYSKGFLIMGGPIDKDKYAEAEKLAEKCQKEAIGMSHGFVYTYSDKAREIIGKYRTWEVSHLPIAKAANVWTAIDILTKEVQMLDPEKRKYIVELHGEDAATSIENKVADLSKDLESLGIESKDVGLSVAEAPPTDAVVQEALKAIIENEGFKAMITTIQTLTDSVKELKETDLPALVKRIEDIEGVSKAVAEKADKKIDDIISEAFTSKSGSFQASKEGDPPTKEEKEQELITSVSAPIATDMMNGFFGPAKPTT